METFTAWWEQLLKPIPDGLQGLWFGLAEFEPGGWQIYAAGTDRFDADDASAEWAVGPYAWWPQERFPVPRVGDLPVREAVEYAAELVRGAAPWRDIAVRGVAVGFDGGDFVLVFQRP
jgi:hypothetical protein